MIGRLAGGDDLREIRGPRDAGDPDWMIRGIAKDLMGMIGSAAIISLRESSVRRRVHYWNTAAAAHNWVSSRGGTTTACCRSQVPHGRNKS
jgi:hypothetical protein